MVNTKEIPPEAILLGVYLELQNGESRAQILITQFLLRNVSIFPEGGWSPGIMSLFFFFFFGLMVLNCDCCFHRKHTAGPTDHQTEPAPPLRHAHLLP